MNLLFTSRLHLWDDSRAVSEFWKLFWSAVALKKSTDMSVIGYIAQSRKNTLDGLPDL